MTSQLNIKKVKAFVYFSKNFFLSEPSNFIRPFIRWAGGKQSLVKYLLDNAPEEKKIKKYWEPFLGAGSLFFANGFTNAEISDVNPHLINAYQKIKENPLSVYQKLMSHKGRLSQDYYYEVREKYNGHLEEDTIEQAARFIFLVHTSFNGIYRVNRKGEYNVPFGKEKPSLPSLDHLYRASNKLQSVTVAKRSYHEILPLVKKGDFIYFDPPYPKMDEKEQFQQFTVDKFSLKDQEYLADVASELKRKGCFVMMSNSKIPVIELLYSNWNILEVPVVRYVNCKKERVKVNELIIKNY